MRYLITGLFCLISAPACACSAPPSDLTLQPTYIQPDLHQVYEQGMWAIWLNPAFFAPAAARITVDLLESTRYAALTDYDMRWPSNLTAGLRFNVYLHVEGKNEGFGDYGWGNGVDPTDFRRGANSGVPDQN